MPDKLKQLLAKLQPSGSVLQQSVQSGAWLGLTNVLSRGLQLLMVIILANLLDPADFGLIGIALLVLSGLRNLSDLGLDAAVIQETDENIDRYLDTLWTIEIVRGLVLAVVILALAPIIAQVFDEPRATLVVQVIALSPIFIALRNPGVVYFQKDLDFHLEFLYQMSGSVLRFAVSLGWALLSPSVWALVAGLVASEFAMMAFSHIAHSYRPWLAFHRERAAEMIDYGKWVTGNSILYFLSTEGDDVIIGWLLTSTALGFYQTGYRLSNAPATELSNVIRGVLFPAFSTLQDDLDSLREAYYRSLQMTMFIACPAALGIAAVADVFVGTFMGAAWLPMVTAMQILSVYGLFRAIGQTMGPLWKAIGRPDLQTKLTSLRVTILAILIIPATNTYGIEGAAILVTGVWFFPMFPLDVYVTVTQIDGSYRRFANELVYPLVAGALMFGAVRGVKTWFDISTGVLEFIFLLLVGAVVYVVMAALLALRSPWGIEDNVRSLFGAMG